MPLAPRLVEAAQKTLQACQAVGVMLATAESCTGGLIVASLTAISGSSCVVDAGFITYSNQAKTRLLNVPAALLEAHGAVSRPVAEAMAEGALANSQADIAVAVTGIAGPGGGSKEKPVGSVHIACALRSEETQHQLCSYGTRLREEIRVQTVVDALKMVQARLESVS